MDSVKFYGVIDKAEGLIKAIESATPEERKEQPSHAFGQDYNRVRAIVAEVLPQAKDLLPPEATFNDKRDDCPCLQRYIELLAWTKQLYEMLIRENQSITGMYSFGLRQSQW